ncbi:hypothetical protein BGX28_004279 [Mortierella sp. GBA30]|nr:hypothetical protein BGX28_004279 [Mortierella sp. GBA30]
MAATNCTTNTSASVEDESILSFLTTDFIESQTTNSVYDSTQFFDTLHDDNSLKYHDLLHPPSPPTSVGTFSESSGSPQHSNMDSCDEGSSSDVPMDSNPLEYWQYVYSDLDQSNTAFPVLNDPTQQQQQQGQPQPGAWPLLSAVDSSLLQPSVVPTFGSGSLFESNGAGEPNNNPSPNNTSKTNSNNNNSNSNASSNINGKRTIGNGAAPNTPPSPVSSVKAEKKTKRAKKQAPAPSHPAPLLPLAPLKPLISLAPQPTPPSPPVSVHDTFIKQSPPLSPCIMPAPTADTGAGGAAMTARRPSIIPALTPSLARSNPVIVKSTLIPDEKPQSEAVLTAQAKRQERLIKNRAAALLSRKRKREHINLLESHTDMLKTDNQELRERVSELEENVKILTEERDSARKECERLHRQISVLTHRPNTHSDTILMDMDLERNIRNIDAERGLNSKATGVVFMIILFSFALFNLPSGKLETLMVGGSMGRPRIGSSIVGRALDSYAKNPTISGQVRETPANKQDMNNMTDLVVFSDNRALQTWLGHQPVIITKKATAESPKAVSTPIVQKVTNNENSPLGTTEEQEETTKSVGFVAQGREQQLPWARQDASEMNEPDRDAWLYCSNLLYSLRPSSVTKAAGSAQATNGEIRRPRLSFISPLDGVVGSTTTEKNHLPPWMAGANANEGGDASEQRYLRLDVEVTSSRVVSGKGLDDHEQVIRFPLMPVGVFDNSTTSLAPSQPSTAPTPVIVASAASESSSSSSSSSSSGRRRSSSSQSRSSRVNAQGGVMKTRRIYEAKDQFFKAAQAATRARAAAMSFTDSSSSLAPIKEEPMEVYIKEEPMD